MWNSAHRAVIIRKARVLETPGPGFPQGMRKSMKKSTPTYKESTGKKLIKDIYQIETIALGEGVAACQVCGAELPDGAAVTVFAYRPAGQSTYDLAYVSCGESEHDLLTYFTLGVRDLLVDGHVGRCSDPRTDTSWPVLLDPAIRAISPADSTTARIAPVSTPNQRPDLQSPNAPAASETLNAHADASTSESTVASTAPASDEVSWVYGDALLEREASNDPTSARDVEGWATDGEIITAQSSTTTTDHEQPGEDEAIEGGEC